MNHIIEKNRQDFFFSCIKCDPVINLKANLQIFLMSYITHFVHDDTKEIEWVTIQILKNTHLHSKTLAANALDQLNIH